MSTTLKKLSAFLKSNSVSVAVQFSYLQAETGLNCLTTTEMEKKKIQNEKVE